MKSNRGWLMMLVVVLSVDCCQQAVAETMAEINASTFGWQPSDATECLQKAIDSGAKKLVIDRQSGDWIIRPIFIAGKTDMEIVVADGVTVRAKKNEFHDRNDCLLTFLSCTNVTFRGEGVARCVMNKRDYLDKQKYAWSEWRHMLNIGGDHRRSGTCVGMTIRDIELRSSGGDGIYVCAGARDVRLFNVKCHDHDRQGISIISCEHFLARGCVFGNTCGTAPQCGCDLEPNMPKDRLTDIVFEDCTFENNAYCGIEVCACTLNSTTHPISCTFRRCKVSGNGDAALYVYGFRNTWSDERIGSVRGTVVFEDCEGFGNRNGALRLYECVTNGLQIVVRNCRFDATGAKNAVSISGQLPYDFAGFSCENVRIVSDRAETIAFTPFYGAGAKDCHGTITCVNSKNGRQSVVDLERWAVEHPSRPECLLFKTGPIDYKRLHPAVHGQLKDAVSTGFIDTKFTFVQCLPAAGEYDLEIEVEKRQPNCEPNAFYRLTDMNGTDLGTFPLKKGKNKVVLRPNGRNVYQLHLDLGKGKANVRSRHSGCGVEAVAPIQTFGVHKRRYFVVPASATEVRVKVALQGENSGALYDARGQCVAERKSGEPGGRIFFAKRTPTAKDEFWSVGFDSNIWLNGYQIGAPALPIAFASPESAMVIK